MRWPPPMRLLLAANRFAEAWIAVHAERPSTEEKCEATFSERHAAEGHLVSCEPCRVMHRLCDDLEKARQAWLATRAEELAGDTQPLFYVQDSRGYVGNAVSWWCPDSNGYTCHLNEAGLYSEEACRSMRDTDIPWPRELVERAAS